MADPPASSQDPAAEPDAVPAGATASGDSSTPTWATAKAQVEARKAELRARVASMTPEQRKRRKMLQIGGGVVAAILLVAVVVAVSSGGSKDDYWVAVYNYTGEEISYTVQGGSSGLEVYCSGAVAANPNPSNDFGAPRDVCKTGKDHRQLKALSIVVSGMSSQRVEGIDLTTGTIKGGLLDGFEAHGSDVYYESNDLWALASHRATPSGALVVPQGTSDGVGSDATTTPAQQQPEPATFHFNFTLANDSDAALALFECKLADGDGQATGPDCAASAELAPAGGRSSWTVEWTPRLGLSNPPWLQVSASLDDGSSPSALYRVQNLSQWATIEIHVTSDAITATCMDGCTAQEP